MAVAIGAVAIYELRPMTTSAEDASLTIVPASQMVNEGDAFTASVIQNASVATIGTQVDLTFDPALVQVVSVERGPAWAGALFLMGVGGQTQAEAIAQANTTGTLPNIALFFLPGSGPVAQGESTLFTVGMQARPAVGGTSPITLSNASMFDTIPNPFPISLSVALTNGEVNVIGPTPGLETPTPMPTPMPTPTPSPTPITPVEASLRIAPETQTVNEGDAFTLVVVQEANLVTTATRVDLAFDPALMQVVSVERGPAWAGAALVLGMSPQTNEQAIAEANSTGTLQNVTLFFVPGTGSVQAGENSFVMVTMQARPAVGGTSPIALSGAQMIDADGIFLSVGTNNGEVIVLVQTPSPTPTATPTAMPTVTPVAPSCNGMPATIVGTAGSDRIVGTGASDVIVAGNGDDVILGQSGDDIICGGPGDDVVWGGRADDRLFGGPGDDVLRGGAGDDHLDGGQGQDRCTGAAGADVAVDCERKSAVP